MIPACAGMCSGCHLKADSPGREPSAGNLYLVEGFGQFKILPFGKGAIALSHSFFPFRRFEVGGLALMASKGLSLIHI